LVRVFLRNSPGEIGPGGVIVLELTSSKRLAG
jgi:hypothetical protein